MSGKSDIYFLAYDDKQSTASRHLVLLIDLAPPSSQIDLNGKTPDALPAWFTEPVHILIHSQDGATGGALVGVKEIHYRVDGGGWQTHGGDSATFDVTSDGAHTVEYYAVDKVGNQEDTHSVHFKIDQTPPTAP